MSPRSYSSYLSAPDEKAFEPQTIPEALERRGRSRAPARVLQRRPNPGPDTPRRRSRYPAASHPARSKSSIGPIGPMGPICTKSRVSATSSSGPPTRQLGKPSTSGRFSHAGEVTSHNRHNILPYKHLCSRRGFTKAASYIALHTIQAQKGK